MKQVPLREFQLHASDYLKELPIVLTQYNRPIAMILPHGQITTAGTKPEQPQVNTSVNTYASGSPKVGTTLKEEVEELQEKSEWPTTYLGKPLSGKKAKCPVCYAIVPTEFSNDHYNKKHSDI